MWRCFWAARGAPRHEKLTRLGSKGACSKVEICVLLITRNFKDGSDSSPRKDVIGLPETSKIVGFGSSGFGNREALGLWEFGLSILFCQSYFLIESKMIDAAILEVNLSEFHSSCLLRDETRAVQTFLPDMLCTCDIWNSLQRIK